MPPPPEDTEPEGDAAVEVDSAWPRSRMLAVAGTVVAAAVTLVFLTLGDGVEASGHGLHRQVLAYGHPVTWLLLFVTCLLIAADCGTELLRRCCGYAALVSYIAFLIALLFR